MANFLQGIGDLFTGGGAQAGATAVQRDLAARQAAGQAAYGQAYNTGSAAINAGAEKATAAYAPLSALGTKYGAATDLLENALGVRGQPGSDAALAAFKGSVPYQSQIDLGNEAINRRRTAGGMLASGNADRDAQLFGQQTALQNYGDWRNSLQGFVNPELSATSGAAGGIANVATGAAKSLEELGLAQAAGTTGQSTALAAPNAQAITGYYGAPAQGAQNAIRLGLNLAALGTGQFGRSAGAANPYQPQDAPISGYFQPGQSFGAAPSGQPRGYTNFG